MRPVKYSDVVGHAHGRPSTRTTPPKETRRSPRPRIVPRPRTRGRPLPSPQPAPHRWKQLASFGTPPLLLASDGLAVVVGAAGTEFVSRWLGLEARSLETIAFGALLLLLFSLGGLYRSRLSLSVLDDLPRLQGRWLAAGALLTLGQVVRLRSAGQEQIADWSFLLGIVMTGVAVVILRAIGYATVRQLRARRWVLHRTLVVGAGQVGHQVAEILRSHREYGLYPVGFVDADPPLDVPLALPLLGGPEALPRLLQSGTASNVVVAFSSVKESDMVSLIRTCDRYRCEVFVVPRLFELHQVHGDMDSAWGFPLVRLRRATYRSPAWRVKRLIDVLVSGLALLVLAPAMLLIALAVRIDGGPGILFRQERVGADGRHFEVLKFRSLRPGTDAESATTWNIAHDGRLSWLGRTLRKTSLDELPQLLNILRGDMSLVGPRPERPHFVSQFRALYPSYEARHRVPSGLTGWAQVHGLRGDTSIADRARFDNYYIENWSLWLDVKIILRTFNSLLRGTGG